MISFFVALALLIAGYFVYGKLVEKVFRPDLQRATPAVAHPDGVDFVPLPTWKMFMIQFLDIAGLGPIFGTILGAMYGTSCYLWIVIGCIFGGAVHDYMAGMISVRNNGNNVPELTGKYLGNGMRQFSRIISIALMIMCGTVFVNGSAGLLAKLTPESLDVTFWGVVIFLYFILATLLPIDKLIGRIYPIFGACLIFMAVGIMGGLVYNALFAHPGSMPEFWDGLANMQPLAGGSDKPIFPMMFISIACGAVSGFHATQSPLMARCFTSEKQGRVVFYGSMITEGIVGLIWAAAATYVFHNTTLMQEIGLSYADVEANGGPLVVNGLSQAWLGTFGAILAIIGVVACPITSGDTAMRAARLMVAEIFHLDQKKLSQRLLLAIPIFGISLLLLTVFSSQFGVLWRYFAFINQLMAACTLWVITVYLFRYRSIPGRPEFRAGIHHQPLNGENRSASISRSYNQWSYIMTLIPAIFMSLVIFTYFFRAPECLGGIFKTNEIYLNQWSYYLGGACTLAVCLIFAAWSRKLLGKARNGNISLMED